MAGTVTRKASPARLVRAFDAATRPLRELAGRTMFGYPAVFLRGHMVAGLVRDRMVLRLGEADRARFLAREGGEPFVAMGRTMRHWVVVPPAMVAQPARLGRWLRRALAHGRSLPAKSNTGSRSAARPPGRA